MKLTQTTVNKLKITNGKAEQIFMDHEVKGLGLRIREAGSQNYIVNYRLGDRRGRYKIGKTSTWTLEEARKEARRVQQIVDRGDDPATQKATKLAASSLLFSAVAADYLAARKSTMKVRSHVECTRHLNKAWKPIHGLALGAVDKAAVSARLREIAQTNGNTAANRARATLSAMYAWAIGEGLCETNPVNGTNKADGGKTRDRVLSDPELAAVWNAATDGDLGHITRLLMLTGQRRSEIGELRWSEIDMAAKTITLPGDRTKNGRTHIVPLSSDVLSILKDVPHRDGRDLLFGDAAGGFNGWSKAKTALCERLDEDVKPWTLHDLRRTAATRMADSGVQPHIIEAVLNHVSGHKGGVAGVYNRAAYEPEKRQALDALESYIRTAIAKATGANVTRLSRKP